MNRPFDLHLHSRFSDGTDDPRDIVRAAKEAGLEFIALTDHDTMMGVPEALAAGREFGLPVISGIEFDTKFPCLLHMLGYGMDPEHPTLKRALLEAERGRNLRNEAILDRLAAMGKDARPFMKAKEGTVTRLNIAIALVEGGLAESRKEVFTTLIGKNCPAFVEPSHRLTPEDTIALSHEAGGIAVLAHPGKFDNFDEIEKYIALGLDGIEVWSPFNTPEQTEMLTALCKKKKLLLTGGSNFHGTYGEKTVTIGSYATPQEHLDKLMGYKAKKKRAQRKAEKEAAAKAAAEE